MNNIITLLSKLSIEQRQLLVEYLTCPTSSDEDGFFDYMFDSYLEEFFKDYPNVKVITMHDEYVYVEIDGYGRLQYQSDCNYSENLIDVIADILGVIK